VILGISVKLSLFKFLFNGGQGIFAAFVVSFPISRNAVFGEEDLPVMSVQMMSLRFADLRPFSERESTNFVPRSVVPFVGIEAALGVCS
jgi:hypothetical protein